MEIAVDIHNYGRRREYEKGRKDKSEKMSKGRRGWHSKCIATPSPAGTCMYLYIHRTTARYIIDTFIDGRHVQPLWTKICWPGQHLASNTSLSIKYGPTSKQHKTPPKLRSSMRADARDMRRASNQKLVPPAHFWFNDPA
ncbi:uncharacterized protein MCYG_01994 [Microsporum canis CBS 113480]|uniref:Uncharacterized protein n=1 Tax=Arthroderma otae (strain ATCC MYA-4605 / CBS 113480) TaxID=554155 RepID=C5FIT4_ARTOC|nr:uncharacterized protein MCYG_01994 [Microsporum canis CBS 113480]EEQ29175.1 predicted protein [Microsporum canis CBS 113480]